MKIRHLSKTYKTKYEVVHALEDVHLYLPQQGMVFIVGVSGSGKTTLMNMLSGVDIPSTGEVILGEKSLYKGAKRDLFGYRNSYVGLIFQDYNLIEDLNVYDNIKLPLDFSNRTDFEKVDEVIQKVDIEEIKYSKVNEISSGQMQRVAIARALVKDSQMILADEPTGNLDSKNEKIVMDLLKEISKDRLVVVITHDEDAAIEYSDRIIEIEDGKILQDNHPVDEQEETTPTFIEPIISLKEQFKLTVGFIRNNMGRSLSVALILLLVPFIGAIMTGYVFFDVAHSYYDFQEQYGSEYVSMSEPNGDYLLYYSEEQYIDKMLYYEDSHLINRFDVSININPNAHSETYFYQPEIQNILIYNDTFTVQGKIPTTNTEILVTDYVLASIKYYQGLEAITQLSIDGVNYQVVGVVKTGFEQFINANFLNDYTRMAFEENLAVYNAVYTTDTGYQYMRNQMASFKEIASFTVYSGGAIPVTKFEEVLMSRERPIDIIRGKSIVGNGYGLVSRAFLENALETPLYEFESGSRVILYCYSRAKYRISVRISGIFESDDYEVILTDSDFNTAVKKQSYSRLLISRDDANYDEIIKTEHITNQSFVYANKMWDTAKGAKIVLIEFLIVLLIIVIAFSTITNQLTLATEKKKIGIKYSFGIQKIPIIIPYIIELVLYILGGFIISTLLVQVTFPFFMRTFVYTTDFDLKAFDFFYISWGSIIGWDVLIYILMLASLSGMILTVVRKSPIEIIKDL
ncbi:MAG: ABC transporter ATP-binding protein/permease [Bacilli bacterium]